MSVTNFLPYCLHSQIIPPVYKPTPMEEDRAVGKAPPAFHNDVGLEDLYPPLPFTPPLYSNLPPLSLPLSRGSAQALVFLD